MRGAMSAQTSTHTDGRPPAQGGTSRRRVRLRAVIASAVTLGVVLAGSGSVLYAGFVRMPVNHPAAFLANGRAPGTRTLVVNAGSSTTHASLSGDYVAMLRERFDSHEFVNAGVNGATSGSLLDRLDEIIACRPDAVAVLVGGNDVRDGVPLHEFRANMDTILRRLQTETDARIAVFSLTPHGERLDSAANRALAPYNAAVKELASAHDVTYLPLHERMSALLQRRPGPRASEPPPVLAPLLGSAVRRYVGGRSWDEIAAANGLYLLTDHIHLSDRGAAVVADLAAGWLAHDGVETSRLSTTEAL